MSNVAAQRVRQPAVADLFYPQDVGHLEQVLDQFLLSRQQQPFIDHLKALIVPHAGYIYSGEVAASAYHHLASLRDSIRRVVLMGPAHRVPVDGVALSSATHFATPLGHVPLSLNDMDGLQQFSYVHTQDDAHAAEHSLEVHLPFLQHILGDFDLIPMVVGMASAQQMGAIIEHFWQQEDVFIIISTDLSHYHDYETATNIDNKTSQNIEQYHYQQISGRHACGHIPLSGLLYFAKQHNIKIKTLDQRNSGDTAGTRDRVVGYGAYAVFQDEVQASQEQVSQEQDEKQASQEQASQEQAIQEPNRADEVGDLATDEFADYREDLLQLARQSIEYGLQHGRAMSVDEADYPALLAQQRAVFITLKIDDRLRGCIGSLEAQMTLLKAVCHYAYVAAFQDPRFQPLKPEELGQITLSLSILTAPMLLDFDSERELLEQLRVGIDGLIIKQDTLQATFLPAVWESLTTPDQFLAALKQKANMTNPPDQAWVYQTICYDE